MKYKCSSLLLISMHHNTLLQHLLSLPLGTDSFLMKRPRCTIAPQLLFCLICKDSKSQYGDCQKIGFSNSILTKYLVSSIRFQMTSCLFYPISVYYKPVVLGFMSSSSSQVKLLQPSSLSEFTNSQLMTFSCRDPVKGSRDEYT